jgi:hypothetical protein
LLVVLVLLLVVVVVGEVVAVLLLDGVEDVAGTTASMRCRRGRCGHEG